MTDQFSDLKIKIDETTKNEIKNEINYQDNEEYEDNEDNEEYEEYEDNEDNDDNDYEDDKDNEDNKEDENKENKEKDCKDKNKKKRKKKRHYFEHHIRKILKEICPLRNITQKAKEELNEVMIITCKLIFDKASFIIKSNNRKTVNEYDLESAIKLVFIGQLCQRSVEEGRKSINNYLSSMNDDSNKGKSRNEKADILVPPSLLEKFMKAEGLHISCNSPIFLAGVIEYFISQILDLANNVSLNNKNNIRITVSDIENGIRVDKELNHFFVSNNIYLHGSGIVPYIHPSLKNKIRINDKKVKLQEDTGHTFPKSCIDNKFKNYIGLIYPDARYQKDCFDYFQDYLEKWIVEVLQYSNNITLYSKKTRVSSNDIELALSILERRQPSFLNTSEVCEDHFIRFDDKDEESVHNNNDNNYNNEKENNDNNEISEKINNST